MDIVFTDSEISMLRNYRDKQKNERLKIRFIALLMIASQSTVEYVSHVIGCSARSIQNWVDIYMTKGVDGLNSFNYKPKQSYLNFNQINQIIIFVIFYSPCKVKEVNKYIKDKFNVSYSDESVRRLLLKRGLKFIRPKTVPGSPPSVDKQNQFVDQYRELRNRPGVKVLCGDAMHLIHQNIPGLCWGDPKLPPVFETNSGRKRLNILGAYDPETHSLVHLSGEENCNAERVVEFLERIYHAHKGSSEIHLILDNAKYFHSKKVREWLENYPKMNLLFLPPYAPNLNLIERLWRFAKDKLVKGKYYKEYKTFRAKVFQFLNNIKDYEDDLKSLLVEKFEIVKA
jgi:transposase